jgi:hypothetical protein
VRKGAVKVKQSRFTEEQIVAILGEADRGEGAASGTRSAFDASLEAKRSEEA